MDEELSSVQLLCTRKAAARSCHWGTLPSAMWHTALKQVYDAP